MFYKFLKVARRLQTCSVISSVRLARTEIQAHFSLTGPRSARRSGSNLRFRTNFEPAFSNQFRTMGLKSILRGERYITV
jgi:hypothetical protein